MEDGSPYSLCSLEVKENHISFHGPLLSNKSWRALPGESRSTKCDSVVWQKKHDAPFRGDLGRETGKLLLLETEHRIPKGAPLERRAEDLANFACSDSDVHIGKFRPAQR